MRRPVRREVRRETRRWLGLLGPLGVVAATVATVVAERRAGVSPVDGGLLSDLGGSGQPAAGTFHLALVAAALGYLGVAVALTARLSWRDQRVLLLVAAGLSLGSQAVVRCDGACELPGYDGVVPLADAAHFLVAGLGFATWAAAAAADVADREPLAPRLSPVVSAVLVGHLALLGGLVLVDPHGAPVSVLQRTMVLVAFAWVAHAGLVAVRPRCRARPARGGSR